MKLAERAIKKALRGVGNRDHERCFRMQAILGVQRAASDEEVAGLPESWGSDVSGMACGPVEVLWSKGCPEPPSVQPCENPARVPTSDVNPELWFPEDCGECPPCEARKALMVVTV